MKQKMYLFQSNFGVTTINDVTFTQLIVVAKNKEEAFNIVKEKIDLKENDIIYKQKWNYPLYDYETFYNLVYENKKMNDINSITILKETEEEVLAKFNKLFNNNFFTIHEGPFVKEVDEGFLLQAKVIPFNAFNKLLAISYTNGERTAMCLDGETIQYLKLKHLRNALYPMYIKNENSLVKYGPKLPKDLISESKEDFIILDKTIELKKPTLV